MRIIAYLVMVVLSLPVVVLAQMPPPGQKVGLVQYLQASYGGTQRDLVAAADKMPESDYGFKPSAMSEVRTYGAVIAHAADGMFAACARAKGVPNPVPDVEKTLTHKAEIVKALRDAIAFCDEVFSGLTDQSAGEYVRQGPVEIPRAAALIGVLAHNAEMYGISTVYLRAKNIVPPASEQR